MVKRESRFQYRRIKNENPEVSIKQTSTESVEEQGGPEAGTIA